MATEIPNPVEDTEEAPSTGFLPLSLAVGLFVTGLFVLGIVPGGCPVHAPAAADAMRSHTSGVVPPTPARADDPRVRGGHTSSFSPSRSASTPIVWGESAASYSAA